MPIAHRIDIYRSSLLKASDKDAIATRRILCTGKMPQASPIQMATHITLALPGGRCSPIKSLSLTWPGGTNNKNMSSISKIKIAHVCFLSLLWRVFSSACSGVIELESIDRSRLRI